MALVRAVLVLAGPVLAGPVLTGLVQAAPAPSTTAAPEEPELSMYPPLDPFLRNDLRVSPRHEIHVMVSGNPAGIPIMLLHDGPGGRSGLALRRLFDPTAWGIVQFDQRGCGRSTPFAEWRENTLDDLLGDIDRVRDHLGIDGAMVIFGLSWGSTLALAYAERHPENVAAMILAGVFTCREEEIAHRVRDVGAFYPEAQSSLLQLVDDTTTNIPRRLFELATGDDPDARRAVIHRTAVLSGWTDYVGTTRAHAQQQAADPRSESMAILQNHYFAHGCFLTEDELFANADALADTPVYLVNGRLDMITPPRTAWELAARLPNSSLEIVEGAGHSDVGVALGVVRSGRWLLELLREDPLDGGPGDGADGDHGP
jgi:proline iminopeptidase